MAIKQKILSIVLITLFLSPTVHADAWGSIVHFAGGLAGDVVKVYFRPKLKFNEVDIIQKRMDILEHRYNKFDVSKGKPYNYKEVGELIASLNGMTQALTKRVGSLEGKMHDLELRIAKLETLQKQAVVKPLPKPPLATYYSPTLVSVSARRVKNTKVASAEKVINCATTTVVNELMNCYSPVASKKDTELEAAYHSLLR